MRPSARIIAAALAVLGVVVAAPPAAVAAGRPPAAAVRAQDEGVGDVRIVVDELTPAIPGPDDTLRIKGRVISTARTTLTSVSVLLRRSSAPLANRKDVGAVFDAGVDPTGGEPADVPLYSTRAVVADSLAPGARRPFSIEVPVAQMGMPTSGTYALAVEALGREAGQDEFDARKGMLRTFLSWYPDPGDVTPVDLVWLWPLADRPARTADGVLLNDQTPREISSGGRLDRLLTIGDRFRGTVSWIADPALLQTAKAMTQGYQVVQDGNVVVGDREQQARRWLSRLGDATFASGLRALPYADIDATAVTRADMANDVVRAVTQAPGVAAAAVGFPVTGSLYWAPFGRLDRATTNVLASAGVTTVILSAEAMPPTDPAQPADGMATSALPTSVGTTRAVLADPGLTTILDLPQRSASDVIVARQRFLAETALLADNMPPDQTARSVVVAPSSVRWDPAAALVAPLLRATRTAPWLSPESLTDLLVKPASTASRQRGGYGAKARAAELSPAYMARVARTAAKLDTLTSVIDDPTGISEPYSEALLRSESAGWRSDADTGEQLLATIESSLDEQTALLRVLSEGTITFSGDTGRVPVTIANDLDRAVTVGLTLRGRPALRLSSEPLTGIRIEAGKMASVDIDARVVGGDPLTVQVQLLGPEGQDYGRPATITVTSTAYARAAAWVVAAAFLAIAVFVVVGVVRRIRKVQAGRAGSGPSGGSGTVAP
jgi:hypothetical protein